MTDTGTETNPRYQAYLRATDGLGGGRHDYMGFIAALKAAFPGTQYTAGMGSNHGVIVDQAAFTAFIDEAVEDDQVQHVSGRWVVMT